MQYSKSITQLVGAGAQPLLHQGAHELEGLGDLRVGGVGALPQEAAGVGALVVGVEAVPTATPRRGTSSRSGSWCR